MAHKKGVGSSDNGRDSISKRLGVKVFGGQKVRAGNIIIRQRGTRYHPGDYVGIGKDHTIYALYDGTVTFRSGRKDRTFVSIEPFEEVAEKLRAPSRAPAAPVEAVASEPIAVVAEPEPVVAEPEPTPEPVAEAAPEPEQEPTPEPEVEAAPADPEPEPTPEPKAEPAAVAAPAKKSAKAPKEDNLKIIEGIGPKLESILKEAGITDLKVMSDSNEEKLREILESAGNRYKMFNPSTWPKQALLAFEGKMDELQVYQDRLDGGVEK